MMFISRGRSGEIDLTVDCYSDFHRVKGFSFAGMSQDALSGNEGWGGGQRGLGRRV